MTAQIKHLAELNTALRVLIEHTNNLKTLFDVHSIPKATQLRDVVDIIGSELLDPAFSDYFRSLQRSKQLEKFQFLNGMYLMPVDGSQYFSSKTISCPGCLTKKHKMVT